MNFLDTIVAIATPPGSGGIGILRISGNLLPEIIPKILGKIPKPRTAEYLPFLDENGLILDKVIAIFFSKPNSFTGENILEIHGHGGKIILDLLLKNILKISKNIRIAHPGEFTKRAFLNNKIDLIQAESIADLINASTYQAAKAASNSLQGEFSKNINLILKKIINLRTNVESYIDFSEENISIMSYNEITIALQNIIDNLNHTYKSACHGKILHEGLKIVITGKPNAGKSSLFNILAKHNRAIVSNISGTTRDVLYENVQLHGIPLCIVDTAGLKTYSKNEIEKIGIERAWKEIENSDYILWIIDSYHEKDFNYNMLESTIKRKFPKIKTSKITIIKNKSDLSGEKSQIQKIKNFTVINVSAKSGEGINLLEKHLKNISTTQQSYENNQSIFIARRRHLEIIKKSLQYLISAQTQLKKITNINDIFAEELKLAHKKLNQIFGTYNSDDLLKEIFSTFCIGK